MGIGAIYLDGETGGGDGGRINHNQRIRGGSGGDGVEDWSDISK